MLRGHQLFFFLRQKVIGRFPIYVFKESPSCHLRIDNGLSRERQGDHSRSYDGHPSEEDLDPSVNSGRLRNGQILAIPHLIEFKMPVHEAHS